MSSNIQLHMYHWEAFGMYISCYRLKLSAAYGRIQLPCTGRM
jgi:hypothetical protein